MCVWVLLYQERGVGSGDCAVRLNKGCFQFAHLLQRGRADAVVLRNNGATWEKKRKILLIYGG